MERYELTDVLVRINKAIPKGDPAKRDLARIVAYISSLESVLDNNNMWSQVH